MRSIFLVIITALVLSVGGFIYFMMQGHGGHGVSLRRQTADAPRPAIRRPDSTLGVSEGDHVAVKKYDPRTGELASEFVAEEYTPRRGGLVDVKNALARFYLANGQIVELHGATGSFRTDTPQQARRKGFTEARAGAPDSGQLKDVTVTILETLNPNTPQQTTRPTMVISMDNAAFDSGNATIVTEAYTDPVTHKVVPADQVPVTVRSPETNPNGYDFDGRGLRMLWNERDHRLTSLDVIHGERLVIKNPKSVTQPKAQPAATPRAPVTLIPAVSPLANSAVASLDSCAGLLAAADPAPAPGEVARAARRRRRERREAPTTEATTPAPTSPTATAPAAPAATQPAATAGRTRGTRRRPYEPPPPTMPKITANTEPPIYRAEFHDNVRIVQNGQPLANADVMLVDFWMKSGGDDDSSGATTQPGVPGVPGGRRRGGAARPATTTASAATQPTTQHALAAAAATTAPAAHAAAKKATTRPGEDAPIYIYWTGPLHVAPHSGVALREHDSIVTLEGAPVVAQQDPSSQIRASRLVYRTEDGSVRAAAMPGSDVTLTSADQHGKSIIHTTGLEYYANSQPPTAILTGHSTAALPAQASNGGMLNAVWNDRCTLRFESTDGGTAIKEADLTGNVHVDHPQLKLDSNRLELAFAHPTTRPAAVKVATTGPTSKPSGLSNSALKQLVASDNVHCVMTDNQGKTQTIDGDRLTLLTDQGPEGKLVPRTVNADGKVHAVDDERDLHADHLAVTLVPSTRPATTAPSKRQAAVAAASQPTARPANGDDSLAGNVDLESLIAQGAVHVIGKKDNTQAFADTMLIDKKLGKTNVKLVGAQPGAKIIEKTNTVIGPIIDISNDDQTLAVDGAGEMIGTQQDKPGEPGKPMHVYWTRNMRINGKENIVNAFGNVQAKTTEADGTVRTVSGERAQLLLIDAPPTTQPSTKPAKPTMRVASTKPANGDVAEPMARKQVRQAIFQDDARVNSELKDADGLPIQRMNLWAAMLQYDVIPVPMVAGQPPQEPNKRITVPVPGKMLVEDYRPASTQPAAAESSPTGGMGARGATAFEWAKSLVYDDATHRATMDGSVVIDHRDDIYKEDSLHITGDTVIADIEPAPPQPKTPAAPSPATKPATTQQARVRNVVVRDHVHVTMKGGELVCSWIEYNPITRILIAHGTPDADAVFTRTLDATATAIAATQPGNKAARSVLGGTQPIRAQELQWDAGADLPKITKGNATMRR